MTRTLDLVKAAAEKANRQARHAEKYREENLRRQAEAAKPLLAAFKDLEGELVKVEVLKQIWPKDYQQRSEKFGSLLAGYVVYRGECYGLEIMIPGGIMRFTSEFSAEGENRFWATKEVGGLRPMAMDFGDRDDWLEFFYKSVAHLIEL